MATILIIDDRESNREFLSTLLSYTKHQTLEAATAQSALRLVHNVLPDLIIADILMPEIDGFEFVRQLRANPLTAAIRVIFYSATFLDEETQELARACGVDYVLSKPSPPEKILATIQTVLGSPTIAVPSPPLDDFDRVHQRLLLEKLTQKIDELEALNTNLEQRVADRTAELAEANSHLRALDALKDNLLITASHDLRSPLNAIQMAVELLMEEKNLSDEGREIGQSIFGAIDRLVALVSNLLDVSSLEAGKVVLKPAVSYASEIVHQTFEVLDAHAKAKKITLTLSVASNEPSILVDPLKLSQICNNLVSNAIKFTPSGGQITVTIVAKEDNVVLQVRDTGLGIPAEALPHLFKKFHQFHASGTADERGTGLGLSIVQQLVELHGGRITVTSAPDEGSTFSVHLPLRSCDA